VGFSQRFPSRVAELSYSGLCPGTAHFYSAILSKRDFELLEFSRSQVFPSVLRGKKWNSVLDRSAVLMQQEAGIGIKDTDKHPALEFPISFWVLLPVRGLQHNLLFRVRLN